ncbi:sorting nexin-11-like isoform X2 [Pristis pectinata]|nr:sorting nexin-11-like isoform X2 [Pristis pectinata]
MMNDQEEEEFITVRVQDPQIQDQSSWASYVDYKIFLYTNSKAFTVKTSCVRRRYREFEWLRRRLQKNAGLVSLPELPGKKPFLQVNDTEGIERRRQGLQQFLQKVLHTTIFLSDSQLHLFLQTQLSTTQIEACVQGHTSFSVNEAILNSAKCGKSIARGEEAEALGPIGYECESSPCHTVENSIKSTSEISESLEEPAASGRT